MNSSEFEQLNHHRWEEFEKLLTHVEKGRDHPDKQLLPKHFREISADLSLAQSRMASSHVIDRLNALVIRAYEQIYQNKRGTLDVVMRFIMIDFPIAVRKDWRLFWLCSVIFWLPFFCMMFSENIDARWVQAALGPEGMASMEQMYGGKEQQIAHLREEFGSNFMMFSFYIYNNVAIDFRIFAGGILAGLGTCFFLAFNGFYLGAAAGYVNHAGNPESFWTFVAGHSSYELLGMIIAGMAGMRIGMAILHPGRLPRVRALVQGAKQALPLIYGAAMLTTLAALVEGFWSAEPHPSMVKYAVGIAGWIGLSAYLICMGRSGKKNAA